MSESVTGASTTISIVNEDTSHIENVLSYKFKDSSLLNRALTHRSVHGRGDAKTDYERLEFIGDAVLDLTVAEMLLDTYPDASEGTLSKMRAAIVNTTSLASIARQLNIGPYIRLSRGEMAHGGSERDSLLADVCEAMIGAIYRDGGFDPARRIIIDLFGEVVRSVTPSDPKTELQETLHAAGIPGPEYVLEKVDGPDHAPLFVSAVKVKGIIVGRGSAQSKKASQQAAATEALKAMREGSVEATSKMVGAQ